MIKKRLLSFLGAAAITAALTFAVVSLSPSNGFTSGTMQEGLCYEATGVAPDAIVASLNGNGASADLVAYWIGYDVSYLDSYMQYYTGSSINWDDTLSDGMSVADYVKASVLSSVKQHLVLENLASKYGVTLTAEQETAMTESDQSYIDQYGSEEAFEAEIAKLGMRRETYDRVARSNYLYQNLYEQRALRLRRGPRRIRRRAGLHHGGPHPACDEEHDDRRSPHRRAEGRKESAR